MACEICFGATSPFLVHLAPDGSAHDSALIPETLIGAHPLVRDPAPGVVVWWWSPR